MSTQAAPAALAGWLADAALKAHIDWGAELERMLDCTRGGHVEIVLKDISTLARRPQHLQEWAAMAQGLVEARR